MKKTVVAIAAGLVAVSGFATPDASFSTDEFDDFKLHTYASFDPMADVSFIVESKNSLVVIEPQAFEGKVEEFAAYAQKLNKPVKKVFVSFHAAGLKAYPAATKVTTKPMAEFMKSGKGKGMMARFSKVFQGAMDTEVVAFDEQIDANAVFSVDGVMYELEPTSIPGMPGVNIAIGGQVYYQHFVPVQGVHGSKHQLGSKAAVEGALADAMKAQKAGYKLLIGSHGYGKAGAADLAFQINYLHTMKQIAETAKTGEAFVAQMNAAYPDCKGAEDLQAIAVKMYK